MTPSPEAVGAAGLGTILSLPILVISVALGLCVSPGHQPPPPSLFFLLLAIKGPIQDAGPDARFSANVESVPRAFFPFLWTVPENPVQQQLRYTAEPRKPARRDRH